MRVGEVGEVSDQPRVPHPDETQTWLLTVGARGEGVLGLSVEVGGVAISRRHLPLDSKAATAALMVIAGLAVLTGFHDRALDLPTVHRPEATDG